MLKSLFGRVLLTVNKEEKTFGGIVLPSAAQEKSQIGTVVAVSENPETPHFVKEGDTVFFDKYAGVEVSYEGNDYLLIEEKNILAVIA